MKRRRRTGLTARPGDGLTVREQRILDGVTRAKEALEEAEAAAATCLRNYAARRPLTAREHRALVAHVAQGAALCCPDGLAWLRTVVPEVWAKAINGWAYGALSCKMPEHVATHTERVRVLRRDALPEY